MSKTNDYIRDVQEQGDEGSDLLRAMTIPTLKNQPNLVDVIENVGAVLRVPEDYVVAVHSTGGDPLITDLKDCADSMMESGIIQASWIGGTTVALGNVVDSYSGEPDVLEAVAAGMVHGANSHGLAIMNGENAILGDRVNPEIKANVTGTFITLVERGVREPGIHCTAGISYAIFDPAGEAVFINCDGVGTKTEFYERAGSYCMAVQDFAAMNLDDLAKIGATAQVLSGVAEARGHISFGDIDSFASVLGKQHGYKGIMQHEKVEDRIAGYGPNNFNISGSAVSTINEERLEAIANGKILVPHEGDSVIAITGAANPRSNGITAIRKAMIDTYGERWHPGREEMLGYLTTPSIVFYPLFSELIDQGLATMVTHMSGGSHNGKLATPLAKHKLYADITPHAPTVMDGILMQGAGLKPEEAYQMWPMNNHAYVTTPKPAEVLETIGQHDLVGKAVGVLQLADAKGLLIRAPNTEPIYFPGS